MMATVAGDLATLLGRLSSRSSAPLSLKLVVFVGVFMRVRTSRVPWPGSLAVWRVRMSRVPPAGPWVAEAGGGERGARRRMFCSVSFAVLLLLLAWAPCAVSLAMFCSVSLRGGRLMGRLIGGREATR
jgi:hypothetical protein